MRQLDTQREQAARNIRRWQIAVIAFLPMLGIYILYAMSAPPGWTFTGFLHYDQPAYMAFARAFFDDGFSLTVGEPFSYDPATPHAYFFHIIFFSG